MTTKDTALQGQVAVVTGGGRGIGAAIASTLAGLGMNVIICGRTISSLDKTARAIQAQGGNCTPMACDVSQVKAVEGFAAEFLKRFTQVDVLVNNAGVGAFSTNLHELEPDRKSVV